MSMGDEIFVRTISGSPVIDAHGRAWNYLSRSDHHSKVACWGIVFDLLRASKTMRKHAEEGLIAFGINHEMRDFRNDRKKNLDLVICQPAGGTPRGERTLASLKEHWRVDLTDAEFAELAELPRLCDAPVGNVLVALEAKACMTAHQKALPRLYDELNSSHLTIHGAHDLAIAAGFVAINAASAFLSPGKNSPFDPANPKWNRHDQPKAVRITLEKMQQLPRRSKTKEEGYDALAIVVIDCRNDGSRVELLTEPPAPARLEAYHYAAMIDRLRGLYDTRFAHL